MIIAVGKYRRTLQNIESRMNDLDYIIRVMGVANAYYAKNKQKQGECLKLQQIAQRGYERYDKILTDIYHRLKEHCRGK